MDFGFSAEQELLRESARKFLETECPSAFVRTMMEDPAGHSADLWRKIADLGWLATTVPAALGGFGGSYLDLVVLLEETGRALLPGPFVTTVLLGSPPLIDAGSSEQQRAFLPGVARGDLILSLALAEASGRYDARGVTMEARRSGGHHVLAGTKLFVPDAHVADQMVVVARTDTGQHPEDGISLFVVPRDAPGVTITPLKTVDMTRRLAHVVFDGVAADSSQLVGDPGLGWQTVRRVLDQATVGCCAEMVGTAQKALDLAVAYAKERVQFGKPIGSFQAVKHTCVDMLVAVENARSLVYYAAWTVAENRPEARQAVPMAKAYVSDACKAVCSEAIQVHGGIGFTWEHDIHLYYRRALASEASFGTSPVHRELVAQALNL